MAFLKQPPLPLAAQRMVWLSRAISAVALVVAVYAGARWAAAGHTVIAFLFLTIGVAYVLATWVSPLSPLLWVAIGGMVAVLVILDLNTVTITLAVATVILFWLRGKKQGSPIDPSKLRLMSPDSVMPGAEEFVEELKALGWRHVGSYGTNSSTPITASVLVNSDMDRFAEVTDMVIGIESRFEGGRYLVTHNSGRATLPPNYLANDVLAATPTELAAAHQHALQILTGRGAIPMPIDDETVVADAIASEVEAIEWSKQHPTGGLFNFGGGVGALDSSSVSAQRIEVWLVSESVGR